jgi:hypothetical protein
VNNDVLFLADARGKETAAVLPAEDYEKLREGLDGLAVIAERRNEESIPHAKFERSAKRHALSR